MIICIYIHEKKRKKKTINVQRRKRHDTHEGKEGEKRAI